MRERVISDTFHKITIPTENFDHNQDSDIDNFSGATPGNLMGIFLILGYEKANVITSKALGFIIKGRV